MSDVKKGVFFRSLPGVLARLPKPETVKTDDFDVMKQERERFKALGIKLEEECDSFKRQNKELAAAKSANEVAGIRKKYSSEWEQFETLTKTCRGSY